MDSIKTGFLHRHGISTSSVHCHDRLSIDFIVNGESLFVLTNAKYLDLCGRFSAESPDLNSQSVKAFLGEGEGDEGLDANRLMLFVCSECGDLACGAITFEIARNSNHYKWRSFAFENGYDADMTDYESYSHIGAFNFPAKEYQTAIYTAARAFS